MNRLPFSSARVLVIACLALVSACGGGGGGSGGERAGASAATGIRILHGVIDANPIDLFTSQKPGSVIQTARFSDTTIYSALSEGTQNISIAPHTITAAAIYTASLEVEKNHRSSLLFFGSEQTLGVNAALISDEPGEIPEGMSAIKVAHALIGAANLSISAGPQVVASSVGYGSASEYAYLPAGPAALLIRRASDGRVVSQNAYTLEAGKAYTVLATGEIDYLVVNRLLED